MRDVNILSWRCILLKKSIYIYILLFCWVGAVQVYAEESSPQLNIRWESKNALFFMGQTSIENLEALKHVAEERPESLKTLIVSSGGGDPLGGIEFGKFIRDNQLEVVVRDACLSSCANYIFPAAKKKIVEKDAVVGWHGGALQVSWDRLDEQFSTTDLLQKFYQNTNEWCIAESLFYKSIGVKQEITILRQQPGIISEQTLPAWTYTLDQLKALGVNNIYTESGVMPKQNSRIGLSVEVLDFTPEQLSYQFSCAEADAVRRSQN